MKGVVQFVVNKIIYEYHSVMSQSSSCRLQCKRSLLREKAQCYRKLIVSPLYLKWRPV